MNKDDTNNQPNPKTELPSDRMAAELDDNNDTDSSMVGVPTPPPRFDNNVIPVEERERSDRSYLVAVLLAIFIPYGATKIYTGHKDGVVRIIWFIASVILLLGSGFVLFMSDFSDGSILLLSLAAIIFSISLLVLWVWGFVDFILSLSRKNDAKGRKMIASDRDVKWAKAAYWTVIGLLILYVLFSFASVGLIQAGIDGIQLNSGSPLTI